MSNSDGGIVAAIAMTHTPGLGDRLGDPPADQVERLMAGFAEARQVLDAARPDLVVALVNDHFDMYSLENMPTFSVAVADEHWGPTPATEAWLQMKRRRLAGHRGYAMHLYREAVAAGFDITRSGPAELVHNVLLPYRFLRPDCDLPVVPVFTNCFAPPLPSFARCYALGEAIGRIVAARPERVALIASGGISHWPPFAKEDAPADDDLNRRLLEVQRLGPKGRELDPEVRGMILQREVEMARSGRELINIAWDRAVLAALERGDKEHFLRMRYEDIERDGGNGGHEVAMWVMMMGALGARPCRTIVYEPVKEWMGGVGIVSYDRVLTQ
ncbi:hypothetical protein [Vineibacter terrae]|uniref:DODA-type extradiol aromatic ring-opening family dioxygenase n=1 Tax=Vineibacter terrae TaxID=2586908 RepID=UPI002E357575|nr:hypothetical protein [Vineibacter terrae]HEX2889486.1 hypothetical protein [Vineibacter terrae]